MEQTVNAGAAVELNGLRHFSKPEAQKVGDALKAVFDGVDMQIQRLRRACNAAVTVEKVHTGGLEQIKVFPVGLKHGERERPLNGGGFPLTDAPAAFGGKFQLAEEKNALVRKDEFCVL